MIAQQTQLFFISVTCHGVLIMKNNLEDLHNHLFAQLERLSDEDLKDGELKAEINRAKAISAVASQIISNGQLAMNVRRLVYNDIVQHPPKYLEVK